MQLPSLQGVVHDPAILYTESCTTLGLVFVVAQSAHHGSLYSSCVSIRTCRVVLPFQPIASAVMEAKLGKSHVDIAQEAHIVPLEQEANEDVKHVNLSWRSWVVVFCCCFAYVPGIMLRYYC